MSGPAQEHEQTSGPCATWNTSWFHESPGKAVHAATKGPRNEGNQRHHGAHCPRIGGTTYASTQMSWHLWPLNPALLNWQGLSTHQNMANRAELEVFTQPASGIFGQGA